MNSSSKPSSSSFSLSLLVMLLSGVVATPAVWAQSAGGSDLDRVDVRGKQAAPIRVNVRETCQGIDADLQDALAPVWYIREFSGDMRIEFQLNGNAISNVRAIGGPREYGTALKHSVRRLSCDGKEAGEQHYAFIVRIIPEDQLPADEPGRMAQAPGRIALVQLREP